MNNFRKYFKTLFIKTNTLPILDKINFYIAFINHYRVNKRFKKNNPGFKLPPNYFLYETYLLNYELYRNDGVVSAKEIAEWTSAYLPKDLAILEWGCGVARTIRHFPGIVSANSTLFACDINSEMINWNKNNIEKIQFENIGYNPPTNYRDESFDLIYALSVFTHIEKDLQANWVNEIRRILKPRGIFLFTTHGSQYFDKLDNESLNILLEEGVYTQFYKQKGHRMMSTYNTYEGFRKLIDANFEILEYFNGSENNHKVGGQDLWIVQKK